MEKTKSISCYDSAYDLLNEADPSIFPCFENDMETYFEHFDDYEGIKYFLINGKTVLVTDSGFSGNVIGDPMTVEELYQSIVDYYYEENGEDE